MLDRASYSLDEFLQPFGTDRDIAEQVWDSLRAEAVVAEFKPKPDDDLLWVFGLADEDLDELVLHLLRHFGCRVPDPTETEGMRPVRTVSDMILFVASMRSSAEG